MAKQKGTTVEDVATGGTSKICLFVWWSLTPLSTIFQLYRGHYV
jgi:hypothetical protein